MAWLFLAGAIGFEVAATLSLRMATHGRKLWFVAVIAGYIVAFTMLALALDAGMSLGVGYGIWATCGQSGPARACKCKKPCPLLTTRPFKCSNWMRCVSTPLS